jgi:Cu(I)/Ag(I) efflux system membrane fusion protein
MSRSISFVLWAVTMALPALLVGCSAEQQTDPAPAATATTPAQPPASETSESDEQAEIKKALAKLSPEDRTLAEKQKTCPVTDEPLGSMGTPIKVTVEGRDAFVCCEGCVDELKNNFAKYEKKLPEA